MSDLRGAYGRSKCAFCHKRHGAGVECPVKTREERFKQYTAKHPETRVVAVSAAQKPSALARIEPAPLSRPLLDGADGLTDEQVEQVNEVLEHAASKNTARAYKSDFKIFEEWCVAHGRVSLPATAQTVCAFLTDVSKTHTASTVARRLMGLCYWHRRKGFDSPCGELAVQLALKGIRRKLGVRPKKKTAADGGVMRKMLGTVKGKGLAPVRDRALLLLGFAGAFRRAALCALRIEDLKFTDDRMEVLIRRGKEDQEGVGRVIGIPRTGGELCPVTATEQWLNALSVATGRGLIGYVIAEGWLFRGLNRWGGPREGALDPGQVALIIKEACRKAGLDPKQFAAHSLRSGHATQAARAGAALPEIMTTGGWKRADTVLGYIREADSLRGTSTTKVSLEEEK